MDILKLLRIDLNLLISLQVLIEEENVSRAAKRLFITQPAMSKTLGRLRETFEDPLFIRSGHGIRPTPRALELKEELGTLLTQIDQLVAPSGFDPATHRGTYTLATAEYLGHAVLPRLMARLADEAPGIAITSFSRVEQQLEQLAAGDLDFAMHIRRNYYSADFNVTPLDSQDPVLLARSEHPLAGSAPDWETFAGYPFVHFYIADAEELSIYQHQNLQEIRRQQDENQPRFQTANLLTALEVVRNTDFLMIAPPYVTLDPDVARRLITVPIPESGIKIDYMLVNHRRTDRSPVHQYLRKLILEIVEEVRAGLEQRATIAP